MLSINFIISVSGPLKDRDIATKICPSILTKSHLNALLALYPSVLTKSHLYPSCTIYPSVLTKSHLCPSCSIPFNFDQESLMPFLHYTLQFGPRVTYALLALYPSILTKSHLYPSILTKSHLALLVLYPSVLTKSHLCPFHSIPFLLFFKVLSN